MRSAVFVFILAASVSAKADPQANSQTDANAQATKDTQAMLQDPKAVADYAKAHPEAAKAHANVESLTGGNAQDTSDVYKLSSDIFESISKESGGDPAKMQELLAQAMKNPKAFAEKLSPEQRAHLKSISTNVESHAPASAPH